MTVSGDIGEFAAFLRGEPVSWTSFGTTAESLLDACRAEELTGLVAERVRRLPPADGWPARVRDVLLRELRALAAAELLRARELVSVLDALAAEGIHPLLLKGTALAYTVYPNPASRPRVDTDVLIRRDDADGIRRILAERGYTAPLHCDGELLFCQFPMKKVDEFGVVHALDIHWKISTQSVFADLLTYDEIAGEAADVPALGPHARTAGRVHSVLLACMHAVMHHQNARSLVWTYDLHLLASGLAVDEFARLAELAVARRVSAVCAAQLDTARAWFGTRVPDAVRIRLGTRRAFEPSAAYLRPNRRWHDELISNVRGLPRWRDRLRLLREVALPSHAYMLNAYGIAPSAFGRAIVPVLYLDRLVRGSIRVLMGRK